MKKIERLIMIRKEIKEKQDELKELEKELIEKMQEKDKSKVEFGDFSISLTKRYSYSIKDIDQFEKAIDEIQEKTGERLDLIRVKKEFRADQMRKYPEWVKDEMMDMVETKTSFALSFKERELF